MAIPTARCGIGMICTWFQQACNGLIPAVGNRSNEYRLHHRDFPLLLSAAVKKAGIQLVNDCISLEKYGM